MSPETHDKNEPDNKAAPIGGVGISKKVPASVTRSALWEPVEHCSGSEETFPLNQAKF